MIASFLPCLQVPASSPSVSDDTSLLKSNLSALIDVGGTAGMRLLTYQCSVIVLGICLGVRELREHWKRDVDPAHWCDFVEYC
jgi:hypothetical protein